MKILIILIKIFFMLIIYELGYKKGMAKANSYLEKLLL